MNNYIPNIIRQTLGCAVLACAASLTLTSCDEDLWKFEDESEGSYIADDGAPIATTLEQTGEFGEWIKVLQYSETYSILNALYDGKNQPHKYTIFAPTDEALQSFYKEKGVESVEALSKEYVQALVKTMTYDGDSLKLTEVFSSTISHVAYSSESGETIALTIDPENEGFLLLNESGKTPVHLSRGYIKGSNGFVYTADGVLMPLVETVYDRMAGQGNSSIMQEALKATGYDQVLSVIADTTYTLGVQHINKHNYTMLNVTNAVFQKAGINSLADLKNAIVARSAEPAAGADALLKQYVEYHLFDAPYSVDDLGEMIGVDTVRIWSTLAKNQIMMISRTIDRIVEEDTTYLYYFNTDDIEGQTFDHAASNVMAKNGRLHNLTSWLPVYEPKQTTVVWDLADYSEVRNAVGTAYQPAEYVSSEDKIDLSRLKCYQVEVGPDGSSNGSYSSLCYVTCKSNLKNCLHNDRVVFNVGYQGSVTLNTPTLVKGKYRVSISMAYLTEQSFIRTSNGCKGGMMRLTVDDENQIITAPYTAITKTLAGIYETDLYEEIEFTETSSHVFKFVVMDPAASTNSKFSLQFDAITFTPID